MSSRLVWEVVLRKHLASVQGMPGSLQMQVLSHPSSHYQSSGAAGWAQQPADWVPTLASMPNTEAARMVVEADLQ